MSGGKACTCPGKLEDKMKNWVIITYKCNYSAFSGYRRTPSNYSLFRCMSCGMMWRSKASYSILVPMINEEQRKKWIEG